MIHSAHDPVAARRQFLRGVGGALAITAVAPLVSDAAPPPAAALNARVALSDRAIGMRQHLGVFAVARDGRCAGAEIDLGRLGTRGDLHNRLAEPAGRRLFTEAARSAGVAIAAINATAFAGQSVLSHRLADDLLADWLTALVRTGTRTGVLPFGVACDLADAGVRGRVVERLKPLAARAADDGTTLALDAPLPADAMAALLDSVGSTAVRACVRLDDDAAAAVALLGPGRVAQFRYRDDGRPAIRVPAMPAAWTGWVVIDGVDGSEIIASDACAASVGRLRQAS